MIANVLAPTNQHPIGKASIDALPVTRSNLPEPIKNGITALYVAFPLHGQTPEDRKIGMKIYAEAMEGFPSVAALFALRWLRLHNPRNTATFTQPPTAQDLHECCKRVISAWRLRVVEHFVGVRTAYSSFTKGEFPEWGVNPPRFSPSSPEQFPWGAPPLASGCDIPDELVFQFMKDYTGREYVTDDLVNLEADRYANLRSEFFLAGRKEEIDAKRQAKAQAEEEARKLQEYLDGLPPELRRARTDVARRYWRMVDFDESRMPGEDQLIAEAKELLALEAEDRARRQAEWKADLDRRRRERVDSEGELSVACDDLLESLYEGEPNRLQMHSQVN